MSLGVTDFFLVNHKSTDDTEDILIKKYSNMANLQVFKKKSEPFLQGRIMTILALAAKKNGFDIFIPFDSDEFYDLVNPNSNLTKALEPKLFGNGTFLKIPEIDYVQHQSVKNFSELNFSTIKFRAQVISDSDEKLKKHILNGGSALARYPSHKIIVNLNSINDFYNFSITEGSHHIANQSEANVATSQELVIRHIPFRSRESLELKKNLGERRRSAGFSPEVGFQNRRLAESDSINLDEYWRKNSYIDSDGEVSTTDKSGYLQLLRDDGIITIHKRIITFRENINKKSSLFKEEIAAPHYPSIQDEIFSVAVDSRAGFPDLETLNSENIYLKSNLYHTELELKGVREDYEKLANAYNGVMHSFSWKLTRFIRALSASLQKIRSTKRKS